MTWPASVSPRVRWRCRRTSGQSDAGLESRALRRAPARRRHYTGDDREQRAGTASRTVLSDRRERGPQTATQTRIPDEEADGEEPIVARLLAARRRTTTYPVAAEVDARPVLRPERERDEAAHDERNAGRYREPDLGPVGLGRRADELRAAGRATRGAADRASWSLARDERDSDDRLEHEERDPRTTRARLTGGARRRSLAGQLGLRDEAARAGCGDELFPVVGHVAARDEDDFRGRAVPTIERGADVESRHVRKLDVEEDDLGREAVDCLDR